MIHLVRNLLLRDFWLKLFSLALAVLIWLTVSFAIRKEVSPATALASARTEERTYYNIPVKVMSTASDSRGFKVSPTEVQVSVRGESRLLEKLQGDDIRAIVDLTGIEAARALSKRVEVTTPAGISFLRVVPNEVDVIVPPKR
jgi:YbbR domain-containing protein